ncbi:DUF4235 domain-containing protein [Georgenia thermotolerans]|uniref:DUF4235 domain-containing protein n=1 Tax=Georgenia thermotolerans TaxID=527326 RepID=A0A7J5UKX0_9MICO|nr:DUF4235 domain-containing protein [Georgenia thermotolerans]KAE8762986.1 DUF4235 domain-containing protein [Georgenia thermotolerans]
MDIGQRVVTTGALLVSGLVARKVLDVGWKAVTGHQPPQDPDDPGVKMWEVVIFAALSGALVGLTRQLAMRGVAKRFSGPAAKEAQQKAS